MKKSINFTVSSSGLFISAPSLVNVFCPPSGGRFQRLAGSLVASPWCPSCSASHRWCSFARFGLLFSRLAARGRRVVPVLSPVAERSGFRRPLGWRVA